MAFECRGAVSGIGWAAALLTSWWPLAATLTVLLVVGFTQAMNIVDGLNGLPSGLAMTMLAAPAAVAYGVDNTEVLAMALSLIAATVGFYGFNFPFGQLFLADGGAYFFGLYAGGKLDPADDAQPGRGLAVVYRGAGGASHHRNSPQHHRSSSTPAHRPRKATGLHTLVLRRRARPLVGPQLRRCLPW